ncbi:Cyclin-dependent kinase inhibitor 7 [Camellia lanceoleosa]|uniref:Cyclin-dependent kinase inhibitor 7 n=1 Tax=Camellia lanceoleosa TaxID=1840588 RepID=A0ACC0HR01_9ERIC|nr:Cyclin-dependent kinase inhibitor 7 [Camellia lanceoleosa]
MEVGHGRVLTTMRAMEVMSSSSSSSSSSKRRKLASNLHEQLLNVNHRYVLNSPENLVSSSPASDSLAEESDCPRNLSTTEFDKEGLRYLDLNKIESQQAGGFENEISSLIVKCRFRREMTPSSELSTDMGELESSTVTKPSSAASLLHRKHPLAKMPSAAEIEEFFSTAEKLEQKLFADKYNYDIKKDLPKEGRYQWVRLKP